MSVLGCFSLLCIALSKALLITGHALFFKDLSCKVDRETVCVGKLKAALTVKLRLAVFLHLCDKIVKYLDIPIQHINDTILRRMNRRGTGEEIRALFKKLRERIPGLVLRTSLITGLPGEGEAEFEELCDFLREAKIERAGVFPYSPEEGTPAALMPDRCSTEEAQRRAELCMEIQAEIMDGFAETFIGRELDVLVMGREPDGTPWGRSEYDSPDIDSRVIFSGGAAPGDMVRVRIDSVDDGELIGEQI